MLASAVRFAAVKPKQIEEILAPAVKLLNDALGPRQASLQLGAIRRAGSRPSSADPPRAEQIKQAKALHRAGKCPIAEYIRRMSDLDALDDADLFQDYRRARTRGVDLSIVDLSACRMIAAHGDKDDARTLGRVWYSYRPEEVEAMIHATEAVGLRGIAEALFRQYGRMKHLAKRRLAAHLASRLAAPDDLPFLLKHLAADADERCCEFLAVGLLRLVADPKTSPRALAETAGPLRTDAYGRRWFYLASVLRAAAPDRELALDFHAEAASRTRQVDEALRIVAAGVAERSPAGAPGG